MTPSVALRDCLIVLIQKAYIPPFLDFGLIIYRAVYLMDENQRDDRYALSRFLL